MEWQASDVCKFFAQLMPKKQLELAKQIIKHQLTGLDLVEMNEKNLIEIGVSSIHDRKTVLRQIRILKNCGSSTYGVVNIRYQDDKTQQLQRIRIKISDAKVKVKHILRQVLETFKQKKIDITQYALIQSQPQSQRIILANNIRMIDLVNPFKNDDFEIIKTNSISEASTQPNSINSPIRIHKQGLESSLERLISSPAQTIYIQPMDDNDELVQLNTSGSESHMNLKTSRQTHRKNSKSSSKQAQSILKVNKKQRPSQQSINTIIHTNRENAVNQSNTSNYLQNYITSNRQSNKKQQQNPQLVALNNFQMKKHSVNENAFNYSGTNQNQQIVNNLQVQVNYTNQNNTNGQSSLSRGNSIKKMKTFCNGSGQSSQKQQLYQQQVAMMQGNSSVSGFQKQNKKVNQKGKSINMYSTINGGTHNMTAKKRIQVKDQKVQEQDTLSDDFIKSLNEGLIETQRIDYDAVQINQKVKDKSSIKKQKLKVPKQSFLCTQEEMQKQAETNKINNLNEIFSDFLDEQSQFQPQSHNKLKGVAKIRAESLHSRQQVLLEEDSLESTKKQPETYQIYLQTEGQQVQQNQDSQTLMGNSSSNQLGCQRAIKHMSHKSMYALNSNQLKSNQGQKKQDSVKNQAQKQNLPQYYGTFDNSQAQPYNQYAMSATSDCGGQYDHMILNENYNISNINLNIQHVNSENYKYGQRMNTEIDYIHNEDSQQQKEGFEGLGKRGGTIGTANNNGYGRSDSNPARHRVNLFCNNFQNNRYSDQCDDLLMLDMSEEDSILIKQRF